MIRKIENAFLSVEINETGAELFSVKSKKSGVEFLWQGDPKYWKGRSTVLFPICGRLFGGKYFYKGKEYEMPIHGIAKLYDFTVEEQTETELTLALKSNEDTKRYYPFDFDFSVKYALTNNVIRTTFKVKNLGDQAMPFSYGGHPGFNVPFIKGDAFEDYYLDFGKESLEKIVLSDTCFYQNETEEFLLDGGKLNLKRELFDNDALFFVAKDGSVKLNSKKSNTEIEVAYKNTTCLGIWQKPKSDAPYVCIEPWHGVPSLDGVVDDFETKIQTVKLGGNGTYEDSYEIKITE